MNSRVVSSGDIGWIVEILCRSKLLVDGRERFCLGLGVSSSQLSDIDRYGDKRAGTHGYLTMALNLWVSKSNEATFQKLCDVLVAQELNSTADEILRAQGEHPPNSDEVPEQNSSVPSVWFDVPEDVQMFTGRVEDMKELHDSIVAQNLEDGNNDMTVITAVCGMGGVGKTSLTIHYAWTFFKIFYMNVIWINSETKDTIAHSFIRLARLLGQDMSLEFCDIVSGIYKTLSQNMAKTLLIFDNVECYEDVKSYIPIRLPKEMRVMRPYVLLTSRRRNWNLNLRTHFIGLDVFRRDESIEFFKTYLRLTTEEEIEHTKVISHDLGDLPLAIRQAGAYIKIQHRQNRKPVVEWLKSYIDLFKSNSVEILEFDHSLHTADIYEKTIFSTWTVNMKTLIKQNELTRTIVEVISYLNSDNIPIKLFYSIPQSLQGGFFTRLFSGNSRVKITDVHSAVELLADFSLIKVDDNESFSVHRLLQKVVRAQVEQKYRDSQLDWIIDLIEIPLRLNNYDHYENICLLHALFIMEHIPRCLLHAQKRNMLLELVEYKQTNSLSKNIKLLQNLLEQDQFDNALKSYEKSRKIYLAHGTNTKRPIYQMFALKFINLIFLEMLKECNADEIDTRALKLGEVIKSIFSGTNISLDDKESIQDSRTIRDTLKSLCRSMGTICSVELVEARKEIFSIVYFTFGALFRDMKTNCHYEEFIDICSSLFNCLIETQAVEETKCFLERLILLLDYIISKQSDAELNAVIAFQLTINIFNRELKKSHSLRVDPELFVPLSILQYGIYNFYKNTNSFVEALRCASNVLEYKSKTNASQILEAVVDLKNDLVDFINSAGYQDFVSKKLTDDIGLVDKIREISHHPNCENIKNELTVVAFDMYNFILVERRLTNYDKVWYRIASSMLECSTQTHGIYVTPIITAVQYSLGETSTIEKKSALPNLFKFADGILKHAQSPRSIRPNHVLFQECITYVRFIYGFSVQMPYEHKCTKLTSKLINYLSTEKKYESIITLVREYDSYLENVKPLEGAAHWSNLSFADKIMMVVEHAEQVEHVEQLSLLAYSIYRRVRCIESIRQMITI